ncbi:MAG: DUF4402 domain-containing protein [Bacteroidota bacterium]
MTSVYGQTLSKGQTSASATIIKGLSIQRITDLDFGVIIRGKNNARIKVHSDNSKEEYDDAHEISHKWSRAQFTVSGEPNLAFSFFISNDIVNIPGKNDYLELDEFETDQDHQPVLDHNGNKTINVGGMLHLKPTQKDGAYLGTFSVSVAY